MLPYRTFYRGASILHLLFLLRNCNSPYLSLMRRVYICLKYQRKKFQRGVSRCSPYLFNAYSMFQKNLNISCCHVSLFTRGEWSFENNRSKKKFYNPEHLLHDRDRLVASRIRVKIAKDSMTSLSLVHPVTIYTTERRTLPFLACVY